MNLEFIGFTIEVLGKVMVAFTAVMVHHRVWKEREINAKTFKTMKREQIIGIIGISFIIIGYALQAPYKF